MKWFLYWHLSVFEKAAEKTVVKNTQNVSCANHRLFKMVVISSNILQLEEESCRLCSLCDG